MKDTPEVFDYLLKFSMLNNFGGAFTIQNIDDEYYLDLIYIQVCLNAEQTYLKFQQQQSTYLSKENI